MDFIIGEWLKVNYILQKKKFKKKEKKNGKL